jgi:hypothetical protein
MTLAILLGGYFENWLTRIMFLLMGQEVGGKLRKCRENLYDIFSGCLQVAKLLSFNREIPSFDRCCYISCFARGLRGVSSGLPEN